MNYKAVLMMATPGHHGRDASHLNSLRVRKYIDPFLAATAQCSRQKRKLIFSGLETVQPIYQYIQTNNLLRQKRMYIKDSAK